MIANAELVEAAADRSLEDYQLHYSRKFRTETLQCAISSEIGDDRGIRNLLKVRHELEAAIERLPDGHESVDELREALELFVKNDLVRRRVETVVETTIEEMAESIDNWPTDERCWTESDRLVTKSELAEVLRNDRWREIRDVE